ncbi:hypothetical protein M885DRAFT_552589 [Pelagophyceae sp. CCMP2097]|nr:hypothetical protein M885DRAFT_552589 [Pelagophyceae sp. CCMP2097]
MNRGRGTLSVRPSSNPFFQTSSLSIGEDFHREVQYSAPTNERPLRPSKLEDDYDFNFQYKRASEEIGVGIPQSDSKLSKAMGANDTLKDRAMAKSGGPIPSLTRQEEAAGPPAMSSTQKAAEILKGYQHAPRPEHVMYQTNNNMYGAMKPNVATFTADRKARSQAFSNSFQGIKYRDQSLNTSLIRSTVHNSLDIF